MPEDYIVYRKAMIVRYQKEQQFSLYDYICKKGEVKKIYILVLRAYLGPLIMTFFIALFILDMQFLWKYVDDLVGKGLEWYLVAELLFYASSTFVPLALPLAILLSSLMTFGNLGEHYELVAMKAAGISIRKVMKPLIILSIAISAFAFYFSNNILPSANLKFQSLLYDIKKKKLAFNIKEGIFYNGLEGYIMRVGKKDKDGMHIEDVLIYNHTQGLGNIDVTSAKSGKMESTPDGRYIVFTLYDGYNYQDKVDQRGYRKTRPFERTYFREETRRFDLKSFELNRSDEELFKDHYAMLNLEQLSKSIDSLTKKFNEKKEKFKDKFENNYHYYSQIDTSVHFTPDTLKALDSTFINNFPEKRRMKILDYAINTANSLKSTIDFSKDSFRKENQMILKHWIVWHKKFTLSFACLILFFIGAPLGAIIRKGGLGLPVIVSIIFFILYHIISITGEKYVKEDAADPVIGMWISSLVLLPIGIFLTYKATTDSSLLDFDSWMKLLKRITGKNNMS